MLFLDRVTPGFGRNQANMAKHIIDIFGCPRSSSGEQSPQETQSSRYNAAELASVQANRVVC